MDIGTTTNYNSSQRIYWDEAEKKEQKKQQSIIPNLPLRL